MNLSEIIDMNELANMSDLLIIYAASIFTFMLFAWDKFLALHDRNRIPEYILMTFVVLAGAFGALCAMIFFKHKTQKQLFTIGVPVFLWIHLTLLILYRVFIY